MLLVECNVLEKVEVINEGTEGNTRLRLRGKFQQCDEQNNNGRIYPRKILEAQVQAIQEKIGDRSLVGALDHPANDAIHLSQASHLITGLKVDKDGSVIGECEILSTPNGKIVEALINDGVKIGISSRGVGSVTEGIKGKIVNEDFKLITFDLVSDPSTRGAFPELSESMRENSERAQAIVSKHKKDRVLLTLLESKISEALKGKQKNLDKNKNGKLDSEDFKMLRGEKEEGDSVDEKTFPDLSGDGKITQKDILIGKGVIKGKKPAKKESIDVRAAIIEGFKRACWGDRYDEMNVPAAAAAAAEKEKDPFKKHKMQVKQAVKNAKDQPRVQAAGAQSRRAHKAAQAARRKPLAGKPDTKSPVYGSMADLFRKNEERQMDLGSAAVKAAKKKAKKENTDVRAAVIEGFKRACWGDRYDEIGGGRALAGAPKVPASARPANPAYEDEKAKQRYRKEFAAYAKKFQKPEEKK